MTVARIFKFPNPGASTEMKDPSEVPVANPFGSLLTEFMYSKYSSTDANSGSVSGVSTDDAIFLGVPADDLVTIGDGEVVNAEDRTATITERKTKNSGVYCAIAVRMCWERVF